MDRPLLLLEHLTECVWDLSPDQGSSLGQYFLLAGSGYSFAICWLARPSSLAVRWYLRLPDRSATISPTDVSHLPSPAQLDPICQNHRLDSSQAPSFQSWSSTAFCGSLDHLAPRFEQAHAFSIFEAWDCFRTHSERKKALRQIRSIKAQSTLHNVLFVQYDSPVKKTLSHGKK